jgi:hypothetical protein
MTSKDLKVKLRPKTQDNLTHNFSCNFFKAMLNTYFILENSMSENLKIYCRVYSKSFSHFSFTKKKNLLRKKPYFKRKFQHFGK